MPLPVQVQPSDSFKTWRLNYNDLIVNLPGEFLSKSTQNTQTMPGSVIWDIDSGGAPIYAIDIRETSSIHIANGNIIVDDAFTPFNARFSAGVDGFKYITDGNVPATFQRSDQITNNAALNIDNNFPIGARLLECTNDGDDIFRVQSDAVTSQVDLVLQNGKLQTNQIEAETGTTVTLSGSLDVTAAINTSLIEVTTINASSGISVAGQGDFTSINAASLTSNSMTSFGPSTLMGPTNIQSSLNLGNLTPVPATNTSTGAKGDMTYDSDHIYICVATNTWKRTQLLTF